MYTPQIQDEHIRRLYEMKKEYHMPMTSVLANILSKFFEKRDKNELEEGWPFRVRWIKDIQ